MSMSTMRVGAGAGAAAAGMRIASAGAGAASSPKASYDVAQHPDVWEVCTSMVGDERAAARKRQPAARPRLPHLPTLLPPVVL